MNQIKSGFKLGFEIFDSAGSLIGSTKHSDLRPQSLQLESSGEEDATGLNQGSNSENPDPQSRPLLVTFSRYYEIADASGGLVALLRDFPDLLGKDTFRLYDAHGTEIAHFTYGGEVFLTFRTRGGVGAIRHAKDEGYDYECAFEGQPIAHVALPWPGVGGLLGDRRNFDISFLTSDPLLRLAVMSACIIVRVLRVKHSE